MSLFWGMVFIIIVVAWFKAGILALWIGKKMYGRQLALSKDVATAFYFGPLVIVGMVLVYLAMKSESTLSWLSNKTGSWIGSRPKLLVAPEFVAKKIGLDVWHRPRAGKFVDDRSSLSVKTSRIN